VVDIVNPDTLADALVNKLTVLH